MKPAAPSREIVRKREKHWVITSAASQRIMPDWSKSGIGLLVVAVVAAGCAAPGPDAAAGISSSCGPLEVPFGLPGNQPFVLEASAGPVGRVASFLWRIPEGAVQASEDGQEAVHLILQGSDPWDREISSYAFLAFQVTNFSSLRLQLAETVGTKTVRDGVEVREETVEPSPLSQKEVRLVWPGIAEGDCVAFVVAATSPSERDFPVQVSSTSTGIDLDPATVLPYRAVVGYQHARFMQIEFGAPVVHAETTVQGPVSWTETAPKPVELPGTSVRSEMVSLSFDSPGFSSVTVGYGRVGLGVARLAVHANIHGVPIEKEEFMTEAPASQASLGSPLLVVEAEGQVPSSVDVELEFAHHDLVMSFVVAQMSFAAGLEDLVGVKAEEKIRGAAVG